MFNFFKKKVKIESEEDYYNYLIEESKQDKLKDLMKNMLIKKKDY